MKGLQPRDHTLGSPLPRPRPARTASGEAIIAADDSDETGDETVPRPSPHWPNVPQLGLAMIWLVFGAMLLHDLLTHAPVTSGHRVLQAALIGFILFLAFIHSMMFWLALRVRRQANSESMTLPASTWSPFQSPEVRDICTHLTPEERGELVNQGRQLGQKIGSLLATPLVIVGCSFPFSINAFFVLLLLFIIYAFVIEWRLIHTRQQQVRQMLCETEYGKARGYHPHAFRLFSFPWSKLHLCRRNRRKANLARLRIFPAAILETSFSSQFF